MLEPERQHHFLQLARDGAFLSQEQIFGQLLRDGRSALRGAAAEHVSDERADDAEGIDAMVRIKAAILDGDKSFWHIVRQFPQLHRGAAHIAACGEGRAVGADDENRGRTFRNFQ